MQWFRKPQRPAQARRGDHFIVLVLRSRSRSRKVPSARTRTITRKRTKPGGHGADSASVNFASAFALRATAGKRTHTVLGGAVPGVSHRIFQPTLPMNTDVLTHSTGSGSILDK